MVWGMLFGMAAGVILGASTDRTLFWLQFTMPLGLLIGMFVQRVRPKSGTNGSGG